MGEEMFPTLPIAKIAATTVNASHCINDFSFSPKGNYPLG